LEAALEAARLALLRALETRLAAEPAAELAALEAEAATELAEPAAEEAAELAESAPEVAVKKPKMVVEPVVVSKVLPPDVTVATSGVVVMGVLLTVTLPVPLDGNPEAPAVALETAPLLLETAF
jgi:hypothetical protein